MQSVVLSILVENTSGVLSRVAGLFTRRGYNIDSISAGVTTNPDFTRITIVTSGEDEEDCEQIRKQVEKMVDVVECRTLPADESVFRELVLVKVESDAATRPQVIAVADIFRAKIIDVASESMVLELTGGESKVNAFLKLLDNFNILQVNRTGITAMLRGTVQEKMTKTN